MGVDEVQFVMQQVDDLLKQAGPLPEEAVVAIEKLLNVVEALSQDRREMDRELERLGKKLQEKKNAKTTQHTDASNSQDDGDSDHSSQHSLYARSLLFARQGSILSWSTPRRMRSRL
ncbi:MAG: hypothetical protein R3C05_13905 [Pirellulaceae bacterium]